VDTKVSINKYKAFSLFELTVTIIVTSIIFAITGIFMSKPLLFFNKISQQLESTYKLNVGLRRIASDFSQYAGGANIYSTANTFSLQFNIPSSVTVTYTCDFNSKLVYRQTNLQGSQVLLDNLSGCSFKKNISSDSKTIFLTVRLSVTKNNIQVILTELLNAKNV
jgi:hypothetical protein